MAEYSFSEQAVNEAIALAKAHADKTGGVTAKSAPQATSEGATPDLSDDGQLRINAQCISVVVQNGQVCISLPLGIGNVCVPIPTPFPDGTAAQACIDICTKFGIPTGLRLTISVLGQIIVQKTFGIC